MKSLIVYDSYFGNTEKIAEAIGDAAGSAGASKTVRVGDADPVHLNGVDVLFVGSPTRAFRPTPAIMNFIKRIPGKGLEGVRIAAFDTRIALDDIDTRFLRFMARTFGYAAEPISKKLVKKGGMETLPPEGFIVTDTEGPLREGELERASEWAKKAVRKK